MIDMFRSRETPASLGDGRWGGQDVLEALHADFYGKCYLCERQYELPTYEIDHRRPRNAFPEHTCTWANLFPICETCNKRRSKSWPDGGMLTPGWFQDLEARLVQRLDYDEEDDIEPVFAARRADDIAAVNTADELRHIHDDKANEQSWRAALKGRDLRSTIRQRLVATLELAWRYERLLREAPHGSECAIVRQKLAARLSRRKPFTALLRSRFADALHITALFD